jgi:hypothetical protein
MSSWTACQHGGRIVTESVRLLFFRDFRDVDSPARVYRSACGLRG